MKCRQAREGILDVGAQADSHEPHHIATGRALFGGAHIDGAARDQAVVGELALAVQVFAQATGHNGQHHVIHRIAGHSVLDTANIREVEGASLHHPVAGYLALEPRLGFVAQGMNAVLILALADPPHSGKGLFCYVQYLAGLAPHIHVGAAEHAQGGGALNNPGRCLARIAGLGSEVMHDIHELCAGGPVHGAVVYLHQHGETVRRDALYVVQALDDIDFPHGLIAPQGSGVDTGRENTQLAPVTWLRQGNVAHVIFEIEIRVFCPVGPAQAIGHEGQLAPEDGRQMQAALQHGQDLLEAHLPPRCSGLVIYAHAADMLRQAVELGVQEHGVLT